MLPRTRAWERRNPDARYPCAASIAKIAPLRSPYGDSFESGVTVTGFPQLPTTRSCASWPGLSRAYAYHPSAPTPRLSTSFSPSNRAWWDGESCDAFHTMTDFTVDAARPHQPVSQVVQELRRHDLGAFPTMNDGVSASVNDEHTAIGASTCDSRSVRRDAHTDDSNLVLVLPEPSAAASAPATYRSVRASSGNDSSARRRARIVSYG